MINIYKNKIIEKYLPEKEHNPHFNKHQLNIKIGRASCRERV